MSAIEKVLKAIPYVRRPFHQRDVALADLERVKTQLAAVTAEYSAKERDRFAILENEISSLAELVLRCEAAEGERLPSLEAQIGSLIELVRKSDATNDARLAALEAQTALLADMARKFEVAENARQHLYPLFRSTRPVVFHVHAPHYTYMSSGIRCMHLLCHHLNRLGYRSYVNAPATNPSLNTPVADVQMLERFRQDGLADIVIYPEITEGNPLNAERVVRYLLNRPGVFTGVGVEGYGADDFFLHFADEFLPHGLKSLKLRIPLVDQDIYRPSERPVARDVFAVYADRYQPDIASLPAWVTSHEIISRAAPREPQSLASLYHRSRALIAGERSSALNEAIHCGCPVIVIPHEKFDHQPVVDFYDGNGFVVGFDQAGLETATKTVVRAQRKYRAQFRGLDKALHEFAQQACEYFGL